jgi:hypothetical protein
MAMKKIIYLCGFSLVWIGGAAWGQGHHAPPVHHPVPTPTPIVIAPHPIHVVPPPHVVVQQPRVVDHLPSNFHSPAVVVQRPVVVVPSHAVVVKQVNPFLYQPHPTVVYRRPIVVAADRRRVIYQNWDRALARPRPGIDLSLNYRLLGLQIRTNLNLHLGSWFHQDWWRLHGDFAVRYPWHYSHYFHVHPYQYWWRPATWTGVCGWYAAPWGAPMYYDYGNNVVYRDNSVYINDIPVASAEEYASQAFDLANVPAPPPKQALDWMPLGTFALTSSKQDTQPTHTLQLAMTKSGLISGTYFDTASGKAIAAEGRVDSATQRLALRFPENPDLVMETGLYNLTQEQTPILVHFGTNQTQTWYLVRLQSDVKP